MNGSNILRSKGSTLFLGKLWFPLILLAGVFGVSGWNLNIGRLVFDLPLLIAALFGVSIATVEVRGDVIRYRRFVKWTAIRHEDIVAAGARWAPFFGYVRLNRFVFPWGRIYFALDQNLNSNPFGRGEFALLRYLRKESVGHESVTTSSSTATERSLKLKLLTAGLAGVLVNILSHIFDSTNPIHLSVFERPFPANLPPHAALALKFFQLIGTYPGVLIPFVLFLLLVTLRPRQKNAWIAAFMAGSALPNILLHWL
jgi:hypothetical protein